MSFTFSDSNGSVPPSRVVDAGPVSTLREYPKRNEGAIAGKESNRNLACGEISQARAAS